MIIRKFFRYVLAMVALLALIVLLESLTRIADYVTYGAPIFQNYNEGSLFMRDAIGRRGRPYARYLGWQLNSLGFRGPEVEKDKIHIICIGASETFGLYEAPDQEYPRQFERILNQAVGSDVFQVINVAYPGETLKTAFRRVPEISQEIHPKYAIIYPTPAFYISTAATGLEPVTPRSLTPEPSEGFEWRISARFREEARAFVPAALQSWLRQVRTRRQSAEYGRAVMDRIPEEEVGIMKSDLVSLINALREMEIQPVLVTHANRLGLRQQASEEDRYLLTEERRFFPILREDGFLDMERRLNSGVREVATGEDVPLIDAEVEMPSGAAYFQDFAHFTTLGAHIMAEKLTAGLLPVLEHQANSGSGGAATASFSREGLTSSNPHAPAK